MFTVTKINKERLPNELLFVLYFWGFSLLRPILQINEEYSTLILFAYALILLSISLFKTIYLPIPLKCYTLITTVILIILFDLLFRPNDYTLTYLYDFIIYGAIPAYFLSHVKDAKKLLKFFSYFSSIVFVLYFLDPFNGYSIFGDYMSFGFNLALPAYFGLYIGRKTFNYKWMGILELLCLLEIIIFANRSAILSVMVLWLLVELYYFKHSVKKSIILILGTLIFTLILFNISKILSSFIIFLRNRGIYSYSLNNIQHLFEANWSRLFSGRLEIWELANNMIKENLLIGSGTASFNARYDIYTHNIYFDIMSQYGIIGLSLFIGLLFISFQKLSKHKGFEKILGFVFLSLWFPKLLLSTYLFKDIGFWCFLTFGYLQFEKKKAYNKYSYNGFTSIKN